MTATCRRCGDTSAAGCEDWDCHLGWGEPIDDAYLLSLAAGRQAGSGPYQYSETCRYCAHDWHGVTCGKYLPAVGNVNDKCPCPSAWEAVS